MQDILPLPSVGEGWGEGAANNESAKPADNLGKDPALPRPCLTGKMGRPYGEFP